MYNENYKAFLKQSKENLNKLKDNPHSWIKVKFLSESNLVFFCLFVGGGGGFFFFFFFAYIGKLFLKLIWKDKRPEITKKYWIEWTKLEDSYFLISSLL